MKLQDFKAQLTRELRASCEAKAWNYDNNKHRGMAFEDWCLNLLSERYPAAENDPDQRIIRGDDFEIDLWFEAKETEEIYLLQCKHEKIAASDPIEETAVKSFFHTFDLLKDKNYLRQRKTRNPKILELYNEFQYWLEKNFTVHFVFISTGKTHEKLDALVEKHNKSSNGLNVTFAVWDLNALKEEYVSIKSVEEQYPDDVVLTIAEGHYLTLGGKLDNMTFALRGTVLQDLIHQHGDRLFNWNIRHYLGRKGQVNAGMAETLEKEPDNFFYFNNGISALCEHLISTRAQTSCTSKSFR